MKMPARFWLSIFCNLGVVAILAGMLASWVGPFFEALASHSDTAINAARVGDVGMVFGFCMLALLLLGALAVPCELFGLNRPYSRNVAYWREAQAMHRKVLLMVMAGLSWAALASAVVIGSMMRSG
ncbi:hypothetical protein SSKA14_1769 [Stenotrophomonas sp. SKA14]|uniref:hypothetical protein n=1 Tax=Stenotrophomonas TaxID=40323 RepID=UPI00018FE665|nr:hypothetical protein [Stenotrophomonas sp. SKA14]EED38755.1 hypothetical protein SSKA14_1769 [Stenotrophomonas sp. SKA14]